MKYLKSQYLKSQWVCALGILLVSSVALARPCTYNGNGQIDWNFKCSLDGKSEFGKTCDDWAFGRKVLAQQIVVNTECFDGDSANPGDVQRFKEECASLAGTLLASEVRISECDSSALRRMTHVQWKLEKLIGKTLLKDGTSQGKYRKLATDELKR